MKTKNFFVLQGHTLLSALIISLVISIMLSGLLLLHYQNQWQWIRYAKNEQLQINLQSATNIVLGDTVNINVVDDETIDLFSNATDSVSIRRDWWGAYNLASVKSFSGGRSISKYFFFGTELTDTLSACLYLVDHQRPLQITGSTRLNGNVYLPRAGIRPSYIDGKGYDYDRLFFGNSFISDTQFSFINQQILSNLYALFQKSQDKIFLQSVTHFMPDSVINSFDNEQQVYGIDQSGLVRNKYISGKVILISDSLVEITSNCYLEDVVVIAPEIKISDDFKGSLQLIANKIITIGKRCKLDYPSSILLLKDSINDYQGKIEIGDSSQVTGLLFANAQRYDLYKNSIDLKKGTIFKGVVFVNGYTQPQGEIYGVLVTDFFLYKSNASIYENSLTDAVIDRAKLSKDFVSSTLIKKPGKLKVIKWLN